MSRVNSLGHSNPVLVEVLRGRVVESQHRGAVLAVNSEGKVVFSLGDISQLIFPRSALKLFQMLPLLEHNSFRTLGLSDQEIALSCASHNGQQEHVAAAQAWLARLELTPDDLECGPALPINEETKLALVRAGAGASRLHNNCSGKHVGMLSLAKLMGEPTRGYSNYDHPTQQAWLGHLTALSEVAMTDMVWERDGCGMPAPQMPLDAFARCWAQYAAPDKQRGKTAKAMQTALLAVSKHPEMIAGRDRCCTAVIKATQGDVVVKTGAEGVFGGVIPKLGLGIALKIDDGAVRASEVALGYLLKALGAISADQEHALTRFFNPEITNTQGAVTGWIRPALA